ncbi:MAG TPA: TonB family protein [Pyrinomonadaceae bacterium]|nr:TonB family protein [Pyrinomonadaceae bacterium]
MLKRINLTLLLLVLLAASNLSSALARGTAASAHFSFLRLTVATNDREQDGLLGPVRRVKTETAKITVKQGKPVEGARVVLETTTYDNKGNKVDNAYFLAAGGSLTGKETYKYDEKGNMVEMTLLNEDGSLLSKESYSYEFDAVGNWVKMTTSVAVIEGGKLTFEPSEVTYRTIAYYLDETMVAKMSPPAAASPQPAASLPQPAPASSAPAASPTPANSNASLKANLNAQPNTASQQPKTTPAPSNNPAPPPASKAVKKNAPIMLASVENSTAAPNPSLLAGGSNAAAGGPVVRGDSEAPARPAARGPLKPVSGGILNGKALSLPVPTYPDNARRARAAGIVEVEVVIDVTGKVISAKALKGPNLLQAAAEQAAKQARFSPTLLTGQPVKVSGIITYNFSIAQ